MRKSISAAGNEYLIAYRRRRAWIDSGKIGMKPKCSILEGNGCDSSAWIWKED